MMLPLPDAPLRFHWGAALDKAVQIWFPDGSACQLHATDLAILAAERVAVHDARIGAHLREQILPIINSMPAAMVGMTRSFGWGVVRARVQHARLQSEDPYLEKAWPAAALAVVPAPVVTLQAPAWLH